MSKPEATGESLEAILASIRRSLSEQSTDVLETELPEEEAPAAAEEPNAAPLELPRRDGLAQRLTGAADMPQVEAAPPAEPQPPAQVAAPPPSIAPPVAPPAAAPAQSDALWFLGGRAQASAGDEPAAAAPKAAKAGVVRGPLPPFFGSSAEAQKTEVVLVQPPPSAAASPGVLVPPVAPPPKAVREHGNGLDTAAPLPPRAAAGFGAADPLRNGKANSLFGPSAPDGTSPPGADTPHVHALEAMVTELLRPMLQRWLDENMPRLISAALKDEASRMAARDPKKP